MTRIGILSDTHLVGPDARLGEILARHFSDVDLIIHAGDMVNLSVLDVFVGLEKEVVAVSGNMDGPEVRTSFPTQRIIQVDQMSIGIIHGWGAPLGIRQRVLNAFERVDAIIYGHTHEGFSGSESGIFFFNPGSPTDSRFTRQRSVGILSVAGHSIEGEIITL
jgi:uncharacterized protein